MDYIVELISGPGALRFMLQPLIAILLGIRDGRNDAKAGVPSYLYQLLADSGNRGVAFKGGLRAIITPLTIAVVLDSILQIIIFDVWRLQWALVVGLCLVGIPYALIRGITNRVLTRTRYSSVG